MLNLLSDFNELFMLFRFLLNTIAVWTITHWLYFPKSRRRDYYFTFMLMGVSVFFLITLMGETHVKIEFALGLFAIFGIMRYRTESMPVREMTYLFMIIALSVINGLAVNFGWIQLTMVNFLFFLMTFLFEHIKVKGSMAVKLVQYDRIELIKPERREELLADLKERLGLDIVKVEIGGIDFLRDMSVIKVYYKADERNTVDCQLKMHLEDYTKVGVCMLFLLLGSVQQLKAQSDFGVWMDAGIEKKLDKHWTLEGELGARTRNNSKEMDRYSFGLGTDYKLNKYLKFSAGYDLLYDHRGGTQTYHKNGSVNKITPTYWWSRHRFLFGVTGSYSLGNLGLSMREMYQYTYRAKAKNKKYDTDTEEWEDVKSKSQHLLRSRFQINYRLKHTPLTPFGSIEMYHGKGGLQKTRYTLGTNFAIAKHHDLKLYYRYQDLKDNDDDDQDTHVLGIGYNYNF